MTDAVADDAKGNHIITGTQAYGPSLTVVPAGVDPEESTDNPSEVSGKFTDDVDTVVLNVTGSTTGDVNIPTTSGKDNTLVISAVAGFGFTGTITIGDSTEPAATAAFNNVQGVFSISEGFIKVSDGYLSIGEITLADGQTLDIDVDITGPFKIIGPDTGTAKVKVDTEVDIAGDLEITGNVKMTNKGTIYLTSTISVDENVTLVNEGTITGAGEITGAGTFELKSNGVVGSDVEITTAKIGGTMEDVEISGTTTGSITFPVYQNVIVPEGKTLTITNGNVITVLGNMDVLGNVVILEGGALVIGEPESEMQKATADFAGTVEINEGAALVIGNADIVLNGALDVEGYVVILGQSTLTVNDDSVISEEGTILGDDTAYLVVGSEATLVIEGNLNVQIKVLGNLVIDNGSCDIEEVPFINYAGVELVAEGATVVVESFLFNDVDASIVICDCGLQLAKIDGTTYPVDADTENFIDIYVNVTTIPETGIILNGDLTVTSAIEKSTKDGITTVKNILNVSGDISNGTVVEDDATLPAIYVDMGGQDDTETIAINYIADGRIQIPADSILGIDKGVKLTVGGDITVAGYLDMTKKDVIALEIYNQGGWTSVVDVPGMIKIYKTAITNPDNGKINAAYFVTEEGADETKYHVYTNFVDAVTDVLADTNLNKNKVVNILGDVIVAETVDVLSPVKVVVEEDNKLTIGADDRSITVTMKAGATMVSDEQTVDVVASLLFEEKKNDSTEETLADVTVEDFEAKTGPRLYTNIYSAMEKAVAGETVKVTRTIGTVNLNADLTVKEGVTLYVPEDASSLWLANGVTLTVNGILTTEEDILADTMFANVAMNRTVDDTYASAIIVNGTLNASFKLVYDDPAAGTEDAKLSAGAPIAGAYYQIEDYYVVSALDIAVANIADIESNDIIVNGPVTAGDITVVGNEDYACKKIIVSSTPVDDITTTATTDDLLTVLTVGSLTLQDFTLDVAGVINGTIIAGDDSVVLSNVTAVSSVFTMTEIDDGLVVYGYTKADANASFVVSAGTVEFGTTEAAFTYTGTLTVDAVADLVNVGAVTSIMVNGTVNVGEGMVAKTEGIMTVMGTLNVFAGTDSKPAATLTVKNLFIGIEMDDVIKAVGAVATVSGPVAPSGYAVVLAGSSVDDAALEKFGDVFTEYYIEGALWITVYNCDGNATINTFDNAPVEDAYFSGWINENGEDVENSVKVGATDAKKVTADITYEVYKVFVIVNPGFANVYIDGQQMNYGALPVDSGYDYDGYKYGYFLTIAAGDHTITYDLSNGWSGEAKMTVNGAPVLGGLGFTAAGTPGEDAYGEIEYIQINIQLSGLEKSGYVDPVEPADEDTGMGLTDYLLIVLVVLVVILAILVALRMMRS